MLYKRELTSPFRHTGLAHLPRQPHARNPQRIRRQSGHHRALEPGFLRQLVHALAERDGLCCRPAGDRDLLLHGCHGRLEREYRGLHGWWASEGVFPDSKAGWEWNLLEMNREIR